MSTTTTTSSPITLSSFPTENVSHQYQMLSLGLDLFQLISGALGLGLSAYLLLIIRISRLSIYNTVLIILSIFDCLFATLIVGSSTVSLLVIEWHWSLPPTTLTSSPHPWLLESFVNYYHLLWLVLPLVIVWLTSALIIDRYLMITSPFTYKKTLTRRRCFYFLVFVLILLLVNCGAFLLEHSLRPISIYPLSRPQHIFLLKLVSISSDHDNLMTLIFNTIVIGSFLVPLALIIYCNVHILWIIIGHRNRIQKTMAIISSTSITPRTQSPHNHHHHHHLHHRPSSQYLSRLNQSKPQQDLMMIILNLFCSTLLLLPFIANLIAQLLLATFDVHLAQVSMVLLSIAPFTNSYIYGLRSRLIKKNIKLIIQVSLIKILCP